MFDFVKKLMFARQLKMEKGELILLGQRVVVVPTEVFSYFLREDPVRIGKELYYACKYADRLAFSKYLKENFRMTGRELIEWMANIAQFAGWGQFEIMKIDNTNARAIVIVRDSPLAKVCKPSKKPVDHIIRGLMAGVAGITFKRDDVEYVEVKCMAMGDPFCEFHAAPRNEILKSKNRMIREQI